MARLITMALLIALAYWYWQGPYHEKNNPNYEQRLENNTQAMRECMHSEAYKAGATGLNEGSPETLCANKLNLYQAEDGRWYNYAQNRR